MNIPQIYLIEPYNAYAPKNRKKHWTEIVEEQALLERIIAEQRALQEAQSRTVPPDAPSVSSATVAGNAAGAGGTPAYDYFHPELDTVNFSGTPLSGDAPLTVVFTNLTTTPQFDIYLWSFGDGTTSTEVNPTHVYQSGSATGYTASLQVSGSAGPGGIETKNGYISASIPTVTAAFTSSASDDAAPFSMTFVNTSTNSSQTPTTTTYLWDFGDGTTSSLASPPAHLYQSGSYTASLQATGSYNIASISTQKFVAPAPTLVADFTVTTSSNVAPLTASFTNASTYNGSGTVDYLWVFGDGTSSSLASPSHIYDTGSFDVRLTATESLYNIAVSKSLDGGITASVPTLTAAFTFTTSSNSAESTATFLNTLNGAGGTVYDGHGTLTYLWDLGSGSLTSSANVPSPTTYTVNGTYTASLQVTESSYGLSSSVEHGWILS